ncbi:MAG: hypothetical protein K6A81_02625 [Clostridiales bacterium]|nr:hypothetical protein [Clostridiales bacterium]
MYSMIINLTATNITATAAAAVIKTRAIKHCLPVYMYGKAIVKRFD